MKIVIDTNVFLSALIKEGLTRDMIVNSPFKLFIPEQELIEIKKYEYLIISKSNLDKENIISLIKMLLKYITIVKNEDLIKYKSKADEIMDKIDIEDSIFIATALFLNCSIWSDDKHLKRQKLIETFTTKEMLNIYYKK